MCVAAGSTAYHNATHVSGLYRTKVNVGFWLQLPVRQLSPFKLGDSNWPIAFFLRATFLACFDFFDPRRSLIHAKHSVRTLEFIIMIVHVDSRLWNYQWSHEAIIGHVIIPPLPIGRALQDIDIAKGSRSALWKFFPELAWGCIVDRVMEPITRHQVLVQPLTVGFFHA